VKVLSLVTPVLAMVLFLSCVVCAEAPRQMSEEEAAAVIGAATPDCCRTTLWPNCSNQPGCGGSVYSKCDPSPGAPELADKWCNGPGQGVSGCTGSECGAASIVENCNSNPPT